MPGFESGDMCPCCLRGKLYQGEDKKLLEFDGHPLLTVKKHIKKTLRCNLCGKELNNDKKITKWSSQAKSAIVINKLYGTPWNRTETIQRMYDIPVSASTLYSLFEEVWKDVGQYIAKELYIAASNSPIFYTDDTGNKILEVLQANKDLEKKEQRACHTTVICSEYNEYKIVFYITANRYCYENWKPLLDIRENVEKAVIMSDASNMSIPKEEDEKGYIRLIKDDFYCSKEVSLGNEILVSKNDNQLKITYKKADLTIGKLIVDINEKKYIKLFSKVAFENKIINNIGINKKIYFFIYEALAFQNDHADLGKVYSAICLGAHANRKFKEAEQYYPEHASFFVKNIGLLYENDYKCKNKTPAERLKYHQEHSSPIIDDIYKKIDTLLEQKLVEPNDVLGKAMQYMLNHKQGLTLFLRVEGVKLDNNLAERRLRIIAMLRKTSLFYKTTHSASVSDDLFSLVETCKANNINPVLYLNWLQDNWLKVQEHPKDYLPWRFAETFSKSKSAA